MAFLGPSRRTWQNLARDLGVISHRAFMVIDRLCLAKLFAWTIPTYWPG